MVGCMGVLGERVDVILQLRSQTNPCNRTDQKKTKVFKHAAKSRGDKPHTCPTSPETGRKNQHISKSNYLGEGGG